MGDGEEGELLIRGPHVTPGYWNRPEATAETIVDGWLHTGDIARRDDEGFYTVIGRSKDMYISGGENVYPAEIESVLCSHAGVAEAAVIGIPDETWGEVGKAFVVTAPGCRPRRGVAARLPRASASPSTRCRGRWRSSRSCPRPSSARSTRRCWPLEKEVDA